MHSDLSQISLFRLVSENRVSKISIAYRIEKALKQKFATDNFLPDVFPLHGGLQQGSRSAILWQWSKRDPPLWYPPTIKHPDRWATVSNSALLSLLRRRRCSLPRA
jgi:hypothetical protein